ncbi:tRNA-Thr(GGU) m(6)t(6)A37 methyltransferase TsaA [Rhizomicrobium palustre]|uniref:tRNA-Thr(GGU) m(6)t(6)A37 methyltransferase TsaA n=1 Tax=Rhizomicrobium palustre TaxID=189966 RepID=A0A846MZN3_9PROT|nr:tRNA (N6-threonylcarbamoyladenosine(37)-N6)-methyltransferase TrmO [Rhizomicrobium palustre]NIK88773.1 tRNA-Thr(GGU) m(6)t(6)A37 methyltransferase TsaA [Rhizomicrobium palustre]
MTGFDAHAPVAITPIGVVESAFQDFTQQVSYDATSAIVIRAELADGLIGLEHFSHLHVLYHQHRRSEWREEIGLTQTDMQALAPPRAGEPCHKGIWTSRSPARPSGIGSCVVELIRRDKNRLIVKGLDAFDGTAVLDIKIYVPRYDAFPMAETPLHWPTRHGLNVTSRLLHWDTMNVALALGLRAGLCAMKTLDIARGEADHARVLGGPFFAQGIEGVTGCSVLRQSMDFSDRVEAIADWSLLLTKEGRRTEIRLAGRRYKGADEVFALPDAALFARA